MGSYRRSATELDLRDCIWQAGVAGLSRPTPTRLQQGNGSAFGVPQTQSIAHSRSDFWAGTAPLHNFLGALGGTRTPTMLLTATSRQRVYQFRHERLGNRT